MNYNPSLDHTVSRQVRYQRKMRSLGKCVTCGETVLPGSDKCPLHYTINKIRNRKNLNLKPYGEGSKGTPPQTAGRDRPLE